MRINKIVKLNLETHAVALRQSGKTFEEIATILSDESKNNVTLSNVFRYFDSYEKTKADLLERQEALKVKYVEADISTIEDRLDIIKGLKKLATTALEERDRVLAYKTANEALDSLDKRLGKLTNNQGVTINNINAAKLFDPSVLTDEQLIEIINSE